MTKRSRESLLSRRAGHVRASFSMNRCQTGKQGGSPWASGGHTPGLSPPQAGLRNLASLRSPQLPLLHRSATPTHHGHHEGDTFSKLFPHNGHTRRLLYPQRSRSSDLFSSCAYDPAWGSPASQPPIVSQGHTPKPAALNSPEARAGWRRQSGSTAGVVV